MSKDNISTNEIIYFVLSLTLSILFLHLDINNYIKQNINTVKQDINVSYLVKLTLMGIIKNNGRVYEIMHIEKNIYALFDISDALFEFNFSCKALESLYHFQGRGGKNSDQRIFLTYLPNGG